MLTGHQLGPIDRRSKSGAGSVVTRGRVGDDVVDYARQRLGTVIDQIGEPVWLVRVS